MATLTFVYAEKAAVLGPLSTAPEPGTYDLCRGHAERTSAPNGWEVIRLASRTAEPTPPSDEETSPP